MSLEGPKVGVSLPGGRAAGLLPSSFDPAALAQGARVEREHTRDPRIAQQIAMDHLVEDPAYYTKLHAVHLDGVFSPFRDHLAWTVVGLLFGSWLAGTSSGQRLVTRTRALIRR